MHVVLVGSSDQERALNVKLLKPPHVQDAVLDSVLGKTLITPNVLLSLFLPFFFFLSFFFFFSNAPSLVLVLQHGKVAMSDLKKSTHYTLHV